MHREVGLFLVTSIEIIAVVCAFYYLLKWLHVDRQRQV